MTPSFTRFDSSRRTPHPSPVYPPAFESFSLLRELLPESYVARAQPSGGASISIQVGKPSGPKFELGRIVITPAAAATVAADEAVIALARHSAGDWGEVCKEDWATNDDALKQGGRLFSVYRTHSKEAYWIVTEADRRITTILMPSDY